MSRLIENHKKAVEGLTVDEKVVFDERVSICVESGMNELSAEVVAMRQIKNMRKEVKD